MWFQNFIALRRKLFVCEGFKGAYFRQSPHSTTTPHTLCLFPILSFICQFCFTCAYVFLALYDVPYCFNDLYVFLSFLFQAFCCILDKDIISEYEYICNTPVWCAFKWFSFCYRPDMFIGACCIFFFNIPCNFMLSDDELCKLLCEISLQKSEPKTPI